MSDPDPPSPNLTERAQRQARRLRWLAWLALLPTLAAVLLATLGPITSGDLWWHLRTGEWILTHGRLPTTDPFSHTAGATHWVLQEYGSQVLFALAFRLGGFWALKVLGALLALGTLGVVYYRARAEVRIGWAGLLVAAFALLFALKWELRPHLISVLFFFWLERCLFPRGRSLTAKRFSTPPPRRLLELALLSMVWVQLHAEALFAPLITLAVFVGALVATFREGAKPRHALTWLGMFLASLAGSLASPLFFQPHRYALVGRGVPQLYIEEWFRPWVLPGDPRFAPVSMSILGMYAVALAIGIGFLLRHGLKRMRTRPGQAAVDTDQRLGHLAKQVSWERLAFLAGCLLFAFTARRFFWLTWFPLLDAFAWWAHTRTHKPRALHLAWIGSLALGVLTLFTHYPASAVRSIDRGRGTTVVDAALFPRFAAEFIRDAALQGNLFHPYEWGGYLGFVTGQPVFIDGRTVLFEKVIPERWLAENDASKRAAILDARAIELIVMDRFVDTDQGVRPWLPGGGEWLPVWVDERAVAWVRRGSANERAAREYWQALGAELDDRDGITAAEVNAVRPAWLEERDLLPAELLRDLRAREAQTFETPLEAALARAHFWQEHRLGKNLRTELRHALKAARVRVDSAAIERWAAELDAGATDMVLRELDGLAQIRTETGR